jgi:hypothetical protein
MFKPLLFITIVFCLSCGQSRPGVNSTQETLAIKENKIKIALTFINAYVENCNKLNESIDIIDWVNSNDLTTNNFRTELKTILNDESVNADPIFEAQDYPDKGFDIDSIQGDYLTVKGKNWPEFKVTIKLILDNDKWLIDGCGMINIPVDKRLKIKLHTTYGIGHGCLLYQPELVNVI